MKKVCVLIIAVLISGCAADQHVLQQEILTFTGVHFTKSYSAAPWPDVVITHADPNAQGNVTLSAFTDSACTLPAPGELTAENLTQPLVGGSATFQHVSYRSSSLLEEQIYLMATLDSTNASTCSQLPIA